MSQYCQNCGTRLNGGESYCPKCQKPTAATGASGVKPEQGTSPRAIVNNGTSRCTGQDSTLRNRRVGIVVAVAIVALAVAGGVFHQIRQYRWDIPRRTMERIEGEPDDIVKRRADHDPLYAAEWGFRLFRDAFDGDGPVTIETVKQNDKAGRILLQAMVEIKGNPEYEDRYGNYYSYCASKLCMWRDFVVKHPETSRAFWQDTDFRKRVDRFFPNHEEYDRLFNNAR